MVNATQALVPVDAVVTSVPADRPAGGSMDTQATEIPDGADGEQGGLFFSSLFLFF